MDNQTPPQQPHWKNRLIILITLLLIVPAVAYAANFIQNNYIAKKEVAFSLVESSPNDNDQNTNLIYQPTLVFSEKLGVLEQDIPKYISISPAVEGNWHLEKNGQVVRFKNSRKKADGFPSILTQDTIYTISINKNLSSAYGKNLKKDETIQFRTQRNSNFTTSVEKKLIVGYPGKNIEIKLDQPNNGDQPNSLVLTIYSATKDQLLSYFVHKPNKYPLFSFTKTENNKEIAKYADLTKAPLRLQRENNYYATVFLPGLEAGVYYAELTNPNGHEDFFIVVSNHIAVAFPQDKNILLWSTDPSGQVLPNVKAELYTVTDKIELINQATTSSNGLATVLAKDNLDFLITSYNGSIGITQIGDFQYPTQYFASPESRNLTAYSYSDRSVYRPGDIVNYKAIVREKNNGAYTMPKGKLFLAFETDFNTKKNYQEVTLDNNGTVHADIKLPLLKESAYLTLSLATKDGDDYNIFNTLYLSVSSYRKPDFEFSVQTTEKEYVSRDTGHATIFAKTMYGEPLTNTNISYRVVVNDTTEEKDRTIEHLQITSYGKGETITSGTAMLDQKGKAYIAFSTDLEKLEQSQIATIEVLPNIGATPSTATVQKLIHRGLFALFFDNVVSNEKDGITGKVTALDHSTPRTAHTAKDVSISLYKIVNYNEKNFVGRQDLKQNTGSNFDFSFQEVTRGSYEIVAEATDERGNKVTSKTTTYVGQKLSFYETKPIISLTKDKDRYKPGETAVINITSDIPLRTILVAKTNTLGKLINDNPFTVLSQRNPETITDIKLTIPNNQTDSIGIFVYAVSNNNSLISNSITIPIDSSLKQIKTTVQFDKTETKPKEKITATISTVDQENKPVSADVSLAVVDAAISQINSYEGSDIFSYFYPDYESYTYLTTYDSTTGIYNNTMDGGMGGCFLEGTKITLSDGQTKNIEDVIIGDTILTRKSDTSNTLVSDTVIKTFRHVVSEYLTINNTLNVTPIHKIFLNNSWQQAKEAKIGDTLLAQDGKVIKIYSIARHTGTFTVYNLTTQNTHTFFADGFYVHNDKGGGADTRDTFVDTVYWNPNIQTDQNGKAEVTITAPDNLTTFSALAIANTKGSQFGHGNQKFIVKKNVAIIPTLPNFFYQNDKPILSILVQNGTTEELNATVILTIKDQNIEKTAQVKIAAKDFEKVSFPVDIATTKQNLPFEFSIKDNKGQTLDAISIQKPILPRLEIISSWTSFEGKKDLSFTPPFPVLPINKMHITVSPHIAYNLADNGMPNFYNDYVSAETGKKLSVASYIIGQTENGVINPSIYSYAATRNTIRSIIQSILLRKNTTEVFGTKFIDWNTKYPDRYETNLLTTLWTIKGLEDALDQDITDEITNLSEVIKIAKKSVQNTNPANGFTREEKLAKEFVLHDKSDNTYINDPAFLAVRALNDDKEALKKLKQKALTSSNDRFIFAPDEPDYTQGLAALALVVKGDAKDAEKAIRGLSVASSYYDSPLSILAGVKHAISKHMQIEKPQFTASINKNNIFDINDCTVCRFSESFTVNEKEKSISFNITPKTKLPIYTTITTFAYDSPKPSKDQQLFWSILSTESFPKILDQKIQRSYQSLPNLEKTDRVKSGQPGIVSLSLEKPFDDFSLFLPTYVNSTSYSDYYLIDAVSPNYMLLQQVGEASPQYEGTLGKKDSATTPNDFSDIHVLFNSNFFSPRQKNIQLEYTIYGLSEGEHYQPKTSLVFPKLGIIANE